MRVNLFTGFELEVCAAIGAFGLSGFSDIQENTRVTAPQLHARLFAGAEDAALGVEVFGAQLNGFAHGYSCFAQTLVSQCAYFGLRPLTISKNALWIFSVMGPRLPVPISMRSSSRMGVTSAAVPVKKASSQM